MDKGHRKPEHIEGLAGLWLSDSKFKALLAIKDAAEALVTYYIRPNVPGWGIEATTFQNETKKLARTLDKRLRDYEEYYGNHT